MKQRMNLHAKVTAVLSVAIAVAILLAVLLWWFIDVAPVRNPFLNIEELPSAQMESAQDVEAVLARPLFWHGRQPDKILDDAAEDDLEAVAVSPLKEIKLLGIILTGNVRTAILSVEGAVMSVQKGHAVQGWTVDKITAKEVVFVADADETSLSLVRQRPESIQLEAIK